MCEAVYRDKYLGGVDFYNDSHLRGFPVVHQVRDITYYILCLLSIHITLSRIPSRCTRACRWDHHTICALTSHKQTYTHLFCSPYMLRLQQRKQTNNINKLRVLVCHQWPLLLIRHEWNQDLEHLWFRFSLEIILGVIGKDTQSASDCVTHSM